jgi:hypothetical protein
LKDISNAFIEEINIYRNKCKFRNKYFVLLKASGFVTLILKLFFSCIELAFDTFNRKCLKAIPNGRNEKIFVDYYVLFKLLFSISVFILQIYNILFFQIVIVFFCFDTINSILFNLLVLNKKDNKEKSSYRSLLLIFCNYLQTIFTFSSLFKIFDGKSSNKGLLFNSLLPSPDFCIKFINNYYDVSKNSFCSNCIGFLFILQIFINILLLTIAIGYFVNRIAGNDKK